MNSLSSLTATVERVSGLAADLAINLNGRTETDRIQFHLPSWCHSTNNKKSLSIGTHDTEGNPSSDGFPLVQCFKGCDYSAVREALVAHGARPERLRPASGPPRTLARSAPSTTGRMQPTPDDVPVIPHTVWLRWHDALLVNVDQLAYLRDDKGITPDTVGAMCLGWSTHHRRISIPIFDEQGRCVNMRLYRPHAKPGDDKLINYTERGRPSYGRNRLYIPGEHLDPTRRTLHCAGELDAILGWQHGWQTSTQTGGESSTFPSVDLEQMRGQHIVIAYDNDDAGRTGSAKTATSLTKVAGSIRVADIGSLDVGEKGDLGDVWLRDDLGSAAVRDLVGAAKMWAHQTPTGSSWLPIDLTAVLDGTHEPLEPTVCRRGGEGLALFYPGKSHALIAESEAGKTWLALLAAKQEVEQGHHVYFYDFEDDEVGVLGRLLDMDTGPDALRSHFHYVRPDEPLSDDVRGSWLAEHEHRRPTLVIVDGVTEVMTQHGWGQNDNADVAAFYRVILRPMADLGAAVVALDHLPKYDEKQRGAIGGVHKLNGIDGAAYRLKAVKEIVPGRLGLSYVTVDKDRPGQVKREQAAGKRIADLIVDCEGDELLVMLEAPGTLASAAPEAPILKPIQGKGALVLAALRTDDERTVAQIVNETKASSSSVKKWLNDLEMMGYAAKRESEESGRKGHYWLRVEPSDGAL